MKIAFVGSRTFPASHEMWEQLLPQDRESVEAAGREVVEAWTLRMLQPGDVAISGGAAGPDKWAVAAADRGGFATTVYPAEWQKYGKKARFTRNLTIVAEAEAVVAFWDGVSRGTLHTIQQAHRRVLPILVVFAGEQRIKSNPAWDRLMHHRLYAG